ncbi:hypothetical protein OBK22_03015 [Empedobacter falsenii]
MKKRLFFITLFFFFIQNAAAQEPPGTILEKGDIVVVGINENANCISSNLGSGRPQELLDQIYLAALVDLKENTILDFTDNGYFRFHPNNFGGTEGMLRFKLKTGRTITSGEIFKIDLVGPLGGKVDYKSNLESLNPNWEVVISNTSFMNFDITAGDQLFILNNGEWSRSKFSGDHNYEYSGRFIFGMNLKDNWQRKADGTRDSELPGRELLDTDVAKKNIRQYNLTMKTGSNSSISSNYYNGLKTPTSKDQWLIRFLNPDNWSLFTCNQFNTNFNTNKLEIVSQLSEKEACVDAPFTLEVDLDVTKTSNTIQTNYEWFKTSTPTNTGGTFIGSGRQLNFIESTTGTYYYYCKITYQLKWKNNGSNDSSLNTVNSGYMKVKVNQTKTSPILNIDN